MNPAELARAEARRAARRGGLELTNHALDRMGEMGVSPEDVCLIVSRGSSWPQASRVTGRSGQMHWHPDRPEWAVVTAPDEPWLVVTVVFRSIEDYERDGAGFRVKP